MNRLSSQPCRFVTFNSGGIIAATLFVSIFSFEVFAQERARPERPDELPPLEDSASGEVHAVQSGDTLWDLCAKYLNSPWYWPKIWSYNPQLTNPHWIYPGNEIRFSPGDEDLPTEIDVGRAITVEDEDLSIPGLLTDEDLVRTVGTIETGRVAMDSVWTSQSSFISKEVADRSGRVTSSLEESILLSDYDSVYVEGEQPMRGGEKYAVLRVGREIQHPVTNESYGYAVEFIGAARITKTSPEVATAQIIRAIRPVTRGDILAPFPPSFGQRIQPQPNTATAQGYVLETAGDVLGPLGEHNFVFIDRGQKHGVKNGNTFQVFQRGDRYTRQTSGLPNEVVATLMVLDAQEEASTAIVVVSSREISVGDKIQMLPQ